MAQRDLNYVAGVMAHRGQVGPHLHWHKENGHWYKYPAIVMWSNNRPLLEGLRRTLGGSVVTVRIPKRPGLGYWRVVNRDAERVARMLLPYTLNPLRIQDYQKILAYYQGAPL